MNFLCDAEEKFSTMDQLKCLGYVMTRIRPPEQHTIETFCTVIKTAFDAIAEEYGYTYSLDKPIITPIKGEGHNILKDGYQSVLLITLQNKQNPEDVRYADVIINNLRTKFEITFTGQNTPPGRDVYWENLGPLDYNLRLRKMSGEIVDTAKGVIATILLDDLEDQIVTSLKNGEMPDLSFLDSKPGPRTGIKPDSGRAAPPTGSSPK